MLRSNYFRNETAFLQALEDISNRLVIVPKPARLSALRAELALIAQDLPAEVDIPLISPAILEGGQPGKSKHHRIVRINPAEATSLNSAERVPYLLMVEVLTEDFDFNPDTEENQHLLAKILQEKGSRRRLFDITDQGRAAAATREQPLDVVEDSVLEPANGDLGNSPLLLYEEPTSFPIRPRSPLATDGSAMKTAMAARSSSTTTGARSSLTAMSTPRTSNTDPSRSNSPAPRKMTIPITGRGVTDQPDVSALATHMRTAAQMLAQLEQSGSKRPKAEVAAIKAKIIASMQTLEEQSFFLEDGNAPTFDTIIAKADSVNTDPERFDDTLEAGPDPNLNSGAGAARMENDQKTGGVSRKGDRDDPSAATFGEEWAAKKERIRKSSPYGWMKNWDLVSVIVKTGADLRQEAFACQLIRVCARIWEVTNTPVWIKDMQILVTGESSGLIETITNGVSLHSLKRSLTLASIAAGTNPRKRIATLRDHFLKSFGEPDSEAYIAGLDAFKKSLAAYSMLCYILQLKDRHNGNILLDNTGHIIHIDFGFMLSNSPGSMGFEAAPFKLTQEYIDVLGGPASPAFEDFKTHCKQAFQALRRHAEKVCMLVEVMGKGSKMPCFASGVGAVVNSLRARFVLHLSREEAEAFVEELIQKSAGSYYTRL
jgi:phosphatidylinositol 4-kinase